MGDKVLIVIGCTLYNSFRYLLTGALLCLYPLSAHASGIVASQTAELEVRSFDEQGREVISYEPAKLVSPGEIVKFTINFQNEQDVSIEDTVLVMPIPNEMIYMKHSHTAGEREATLSYDGGNTYFPQGEQPETLSADESVITHVKWTFINPIEPNSEGVVTAFARLK